MEARSANSVTRPKSSYRSIRESSHVRSNCLRRQRSERTCRFPVIARPARSTTECTSKRVPYASKITAFGFIRVPLCLQPLVPGAHPNQCIVPAKGCDNSEPRELCAVAVDAMFAIRSFTLPKDNKANKMTVLGTLFSVDLSRPLEFRQGGIRHGA